MAAESLDLRELERRPTRYWNEDGLPELVMGLLWMLWGASWLVGNALPSGPVRNVFWTLTPVLLAGSGVAAVWLTKKLKAMGTAAVATTLIVRSRTEGLEALAAPGLGVILSLGFVAASVTQRAPHLLVLAGVALVLGLAFGALGAGWEAANWMLVALGLAATVMGAARFRVFVARNPLELPE